MKTCPSCNKTKNIDDFGLNKSKKDGRQSTCKACFKIYRDRHYQENKEYYLDNAKKNKQKSRDLIAEARKGGCVKCGEDHPAVLDFHHLNDNEKDFNVTQVNRKGFRQVQKEIEKCIVLCSNCHRKLHYKERNASIV